ncbi:Uncharacterized conserved protein [[Actinomadura] parvosata subsp. kistnae]|uniref:DUF1330 domain-containing protein n=1 Tax=[Actinomadura] parvosata subsp. kistnae TaxID=1909395 RepID=A0A1U9ZY25_9ACTN|nr:DUF1330 domain-containing protein [Nonomuraea sp. ATCC 55076]AQZ62844.1 hypothetical protein BKM31_16510 [Nonomuraea sp. ATCC 55076]SPL98385.1 Uncharacterized conserved protein [Actinomadura parvosata subsp. kistnae]
MTAYVIAHLRDSDKPHPDVAEYLERIQSTMDPFSGRFIVHGGPVDVREGHWPGSVVMLEFPSMDHARDWYDSAAYQAILRLRADHLEGEVIIVEGVEPGHDSAAMGAELRKQL